MLNKVFGNAIRNARHKAGLTQKELGKLANIRYETISQWEKGHRLPRHASFMRLCRVLDLDLNTLEADY